MAPRTQESGSCRGLYERTMRAGQSKVQGLGAAGWRHALRLHPHIASYKIASRIFSRVAASRTVSPFATVARAHAGSSAERLVATTFPPPRGSGGRPRTGAPGSRGARTARGPEQMDTSRPLGVAMSIASMMERDPIPRFSSTATVSMMCGKLWPRWFSSKVTSTSPSRTWSSAARNRARSVHAPEARSSNTFTACSSQSVQMQRQAMVQYADVHVAGYVLKPSLSVFPSALLCVRLPVVLRDAKQ